VAGVTSAGKSAFIKRLAEPGIRDRFGLAERFETASANAVDALRAGPIGTLVYHYDLLRPFDRPLHSHGRDPAFHLLSSARRVTLITLANRPEVLRDRLRTPEARASTRKGRKRQQVLLTQYENPAFLSDWYDAWLNATARYMGRPEDRSHLILSDGDYPSIGGIDELQAILRARS